LSLAVVVAVCSIAQVSTKSKLQEKKNAFTSLSRYPLYKSKKMQKYWTCQESNLNQPGNGRMSDLSNRPEVPQCQSLLFVVIVLSNKGKSIRLIYVGQTGHRVRGVLPFGHASLNCLVEGQRCKRAESLRDKSLLCTCKFCLRGLYFD
jgi:hypothetical protein